jgi:hypothetical protein
MPKKRSPLSSLPSPTLTTIHADEAVGGKKKQDLLAEEFEISRIKIRKILITTGDIKYGETAQIQELIRNGMKMPVVAEKLGMAISTVNSLIPYSKGVYKLSEVSAAAERTERYRVRKEAIYTLHEKIKKNEDWSFELWKAIISFQSYPFTTSGRGKREGVKFKYNVSREPGQGGRRFDGDNLDGYGNELIIDKKEKTISRSAVERAFSTALEKEMMGPRQLGAPGAGSYLFSIFVRFGVITPQSGN